MVFLAAAFFALWRRCLRDLRCLRDFFAVFVVPVLAVVDELLFCAFVVLAKAAPVLSARARARTAAILLFMLFLISFKLVVSS